MLKDGFDLMDRHSDIALSDRLLAKRCVRRVAEKVRARLEEKE